VTAKKAVTKVAAFSIGTVAQNYPTNYTNLSRFDQS
jgi:hypothetical protein